MTIGASNSGASFFLLIIVVLVVLWLLVMRPQKRRQNEQQRMLRELQVGDDVLTVGGIYGTITRLDEDEVSVEIAPQLEVRVARRAIAGVTHEEPQAEAPEEEPAAEEPEPAEPAEVAGGESSDEENPG